MKLFAVLCALCALLPPAQALDREAFTFTSYFLDARVEPEQQRLAVRGKISVRNDSASPQKNLALQISSSLAWRSIQLDGKPVEFVSQPYTSDIDHTGALSEALVVLPNAIPPKGEIELEIGYEGVIPLDAARLMRIGVPREAAMQSDWDQIDKSFTAVRGIGYVVWYPVATESANLSEGDSVFETLARWKARELSARMTVNLKSSVGNAATTLLCNGQTTKNSGDPADKTVKCVFQPLGETVPLFIVSPYEKQDEYSVNIFYLPGHKPDADTYALASRLAAPIVAEWFGAAREHAAVESEVAELNDPEAAPYESGSMLLTPLNRDSTQMRLAAIHQLTHAAFFSPRPWIYEGLAHFAQAVSLEQEGGRQSALDFMGRHLAALVEAEKALTAEQAQNGGAAQSLINTSMEELYRSKALYVWWMLREMIGDDALKKAIAAYRPDADTTPSYMQHLIESQTATDLGWFFEDWVYHDRGLPDFHVAAVFPWGASGNARVVTVTVENLGNAAAEVPLMLKTENGQITKRIMVRGKSKVVLRIETNSAPREIVINDGSVPESDMSNNVYKIDAPAKAK